MEETRNIRDLREARAEAARVRREMTRFIISDEFDTLPLGARQELLKIEKMIKAEEVKLDDRISRAVEKEMRKERGY